MYKMNYERAVLALWDKDLKRDLHEAYYDFVPEMQKIIRNPAIIFQGSPSPMRDHMLTLLEILVRWILELEELDPHEVAAFVIRHHRLLTDRIEKILDFKEIKVEVKRRGLLG